MTTAALKLTEQNSKEFEKAMNTEMDKPIKHFERELIAPSAPAAHIHRWLKM